MHGIRRTTSSFANYDLEQYQRAKAKQALSIYESHLPQPMTAEAELMAARGQLTLMEKTMERQAARMTAFLSRPNTPFTEKLQKVLLKRTVHVDDEAEEEGGGGKLLGTTTTTNKTTGGEETHRGGALAAAGTGKLKGAADAADAAAAAADTARTSGILPSVSAAQLLLREQPAQTGAARLVVTSHQKREIRNRIQNLESRMRKTLALQGNPVPPEGFSIPTSSSLLSHTKKKQKKKNMGEGSGGEEEKIGGGGGNFSSSIQSSTSSAGMGISLVPSPSRIALRDYVVAFDDDAPALASIAGGAAGSSANNPNNSKNPKQLSRANPFGGLFDFGGEEEEDADEQRGGSGGGGGFRGNTRGSSSSSASSASSSSASFQHHQQHQQQQNGFNSTSSLGYRNEEGRGGGGLRSSSAASGTRGVMRSSNSAQEHHQHQHHGGECATCNHSLSPSTWVRPWRENASSAAGRGPISPMVYSHQIKPGRAYEGFGDYTPFSHSFRDRQPEKEIGSPRISVTAHIDARKAFGRPGELDIAKTALIEAENVARQYHKHPFLFPHQRVVAPGDEYSNLQRTKELDMFPRVGDAEMRKQALGESRLNLPKHVDPTRIDRPWTAWTTTIRNTNSSSSGGVGTSTTTSLSRLPSQPQDTNDNNNNTSTTTTAGSSGFLPALSPMRIPPRRGGKEETFGSSSTTTSSGLLQPDHHHHGDMTTTVIEKDPFTSTISGGTKEQVKFVNKLRTFRGKDEHVALHVLQQAAFSTATGGNNSNNQQQQQQQGLLPYGVSGSTGRIAGNAVVPPGTPAAFTVNIQQFAKTGIDTYAITSSNAALCFSEKKLQSTLDDVRAAAYNNNNSQNGNGSSNGTIPLSQALHSSNNGKFLPNAQTQGGWGYKKSLGHNK